MLPRLLALLIAFPLLVAAQEIPYNSVRTLQDCSDALKGMPGVRANVVVTHANPDDHRSFSLTLNTPKRRSQIKVGRDGTFRLPVLPVEEGENSVVMSSLEKGALRLSFELNIDGPLSRPGAQRSTLFEDCSFVAEQFKRFDHVWSTLEKEMPGMSKFELAVVGVTLPRQKPCSGKVFLKSGDKTVASADLSQTGPVEWLFDEYDPKTHGIEFEMNNDELPPKYFPICKCASEGIRTKNAILIKRLEPVSPTNPSQRFDSGTNQASAPADSRH